MLFYQIICYVIYFRPLNVNTNSTSFYAHMNANILRFYFMNEFYLKKEFVIKFMGKVECYIQ